jgi:Protein of unknown function (DUF3768)
VQIELPSQPDPAKTQRIAELNDELRKGNSPSSHNKIVVTAALHAQIEEGCNAMEAALRQHRLQQHITSYDFTQSIGDDPYGERDIGWFDFFGARVMFKIDYYDLDLEYGSEDPSNPEITRRVLTIMLAEDY